jgi:hypothetical protein
MSSHCTFKGRFHGAFFMCVSMSDKPFDAEACDIGGQASATNGLSDTITPSKTHRIIHLLCQKCGNRYPYVTFHTCLWD